MQHDLSDRQRAIHEYIWQYWRDNGAWPTLPQIARAVGVDGHTNIPRDLGRIAWLGYALPPRPDRP